MFERLAQRFAVLAFIAIALAGLAGPVAARDGAGSTESKRVALVIGNAAYRHVPALPNPVNDAAAVAKLLDGIGFSSVRLHRNLGGRELRRALREFSEQVQDADVAVFYFAGHGMEIGGINRLVPIDAELAREFDVDDETVSLDRVLAALAPAKQLRLAILDACRNNPFLATMRPTTGTRSFSRGLARIEPETADTLVAYAAKAGSVALDGSAALSPFTEALVKHLPKPGLDIRLALGQVRDDVLQATRNQQEPFVYGSLGGNVVALAPPHDPTRPGSPEVVRDLQSELRRVGCYRGAVDGIWSPASKAALASLNQYLGLDLPVDLATIDSVDVVRQRLTRVCPLQCPPGHHADGEVCLRGCPRGEILGRGGICEPAPPPVAAVPPAPLPAPAAPPAPPPAATAPPSPAAAPAAAPAKPAPQRPVKSAARPEGKSATRALPSSKGTGTEGTRRSGPPYPGACPNRDMVRCQANCSAGWKPACDFLAKVGSRGGRMR